MRDKLINKLHYFKINFILHRIVSLLAKEQYSQAYQQDKILLKILSILKPAKHKKILILLKTYILSLRTIAAYQFDTGLENQTVKLYTDYFLKENINFVQKDNFEFNSFIKALIETNLAIYRIKAARSIYDKYIDTFESPLKKLELLISLSGGNCGDFPMEDAEKILGDFKFTITDYEKKIEDKNLSIEKIKSIKKRKKKYLRYMYILADNCKVQVEGLDRCITKEIESDTTNEFDNLIYLLCISIVKDKKYHNTVRNWLEGIIPKNQKEQENCEKLQRKLEHFSISKKKLSGNNRKESFRSLITNKEVTRAYVYEQIEAEIALYKRKTLVTAKNVNNRCKALKSLFFCKSQLRSVRYWKKFEQMLSCVKPECSCDDTVYFFVDDYSLVTATVSLPILLEAKKRGYCCLPTSPRTFYFERTSDDWLNDIAGSMNSDIDMRYEIQENCVYDWTIDLEKKQIIAKGLNIYQPVYEYVSRYQFSYFMNYDTNLWARTKTHRLIRTMDRIFQYCEEIESWAVKQNKRVKFISNAPHIHPAAAYRIYCEERGRNHGMEFIVVSPGYDNYFKNIGDAKTETLAALNMTRNPNCRNAFLGTKEAFEEYYIKNSVRIEEIKQKVNAWLNYQRSQINSGYNYNDEKGKIINLIQDYKQKNKKVILLNGKVVFDLGVKYTQGCAHKDMSQWITNTVDIVNRNPDILLLIKPHPHENNRELTMTSEEIVSLKQLIKVPMASNVVYLDSTMFKISELVEFIDLGVLWNGTSCLEFAAQGIKTLIADVWGHYDYPIGFYKFHSIDEYEHLLLNPEEIVEPKDLSQKAMTFLEYMGSEEVRILNPYTKTSSLNFHQFESEIYDDKIIEYIKHGDSQLETLFDKINL